jgi:Arc/MetJ-type ribon-helix-helix transcriptional regulator
VRITKVIAFSVPPKFENEIQKHAKAEHRTISEYIREAVRQYMTLCEFEQTRKAVTKRMKRKGLKSSAVETALSEARKRTWPMLRAVVDTNITVSGLLFGGVPLKVVRAAIARQFVWVTSAVLIEETERVMRSDKLTYSRDKFWRR